MLLSYRIKPIVALARWDRLVGVWLLLAPALTGLVLASGGLPPAYLLCVFVVGAFLMRSAGCVINDIADKDLDGFVARTANRPLASGSMRLRTAFILLAALLLAAASLLWFLNLETILLALGALLIVLIYPFCKRFMPCPQAVLGLAFAWPILLAFSSVGAHFSVATWLWFAGTWAWVMAYDTAYAMADRRDDLRIGIKSSAIWFGRFDRVFIVLLNLLTIILFALAGYMQNLNLIYFVGLLVMLSLFALGWHKIWQRDPRQCFAAFKQNIFVGVVWFAAVLLNFYLT